MPLVIESHPRFMWRRILVLGTMAAVATSIVVDGLIEAIIQAKQLDPDDSLALDRFRTLWADQRRRLVALGTFLTLIVVTTGAKDLVTNAFAASERARPGGVAAPDTKLVPVPTSYLLVQGLWYMATLLVLYTPAYVTLREVGERLAKRLAGQMQPDGTQALPGQDLLSSSEILSKTRSLLGIDEEPKAWLERGILLAAPLLSAVLSTFIG